MLSTTYLFILTQLHTRAKHLYATIPHRPCYLMESKINLHVIIMWRSRSIDDRYHTTRAACQPSYPYPVVVAETLEQLMSWMTHSRNPPLGTAECWLTRLYFCSVSQPNNNKSICTHVIYLYRNHIVRSKAKKILKLRRCSAEMH